MDSIYSQRIGQPRKYKTNGSVVLCHIGIKLGRFKTVLLGDENLVEKNLGSYFEKNYNRNLILFNRIINQWSNHVL